MSEAPGIQDKVNEIRARRGRPPTGKKSTGTADDAQREKWRSEKRSQRDRGKATEGAPTEPYVADPMSIMLSGLLGATIFNFASRMNGHRALTQEEQLELGAALDPVLWKWLPVLGDWKAETGLVLMALALWQKTAPEKEPEDEKDDDGSSLDRGIVFPTDRAP